LPAAAAHGASNSNAFGSRAPEEGTKPPTATVSSRAESDGTKTKRKEWTPATLGVQANTATKTKELSERMNAWVSGTTVQRPNCQRNAPKPMPNGTVTTIAVKTGWQKLNNTPKSASARTRKPGGGQGSSGARRAKDRPQQQVVRASA